MQARGLFLSRRLLYAASVAFLVFGVLTTHDAHAQTGLTIQPVKIIEELEPGASTTGQLTIINASNKDIEVEMTMEDFVPARGAGHREIVGRAPGNTTVRDWVTFDASSTFPLAQGARRTVPFVIDAPHDAEPGSHFGVAFFSAIDPAAEGSLKVSTRVGSLFYVTIPGDQLFGGRVLDFDGPRFVFTNTARFEARIENTGSVHYVPEGEVTITNLFGHVVDVVPMHRQDLLPTQIREYPARFMPAHLLFGRYTATLTVTDGEGNRLTAEPIVFYAIPLVHTGIVLAVLVVVFLLVRFLRRNIEIRVKRR